MFPVRVGTLDITAARDVGPLRTCPGPRDPRTISDRLAVSATAVTVSTT
ncbi:hypothetical protein PSU4_35600 [Pseudonocardia sulfidoxydans NBRC 16205]|uniref:Uncharacterized protein n=1 Tax=Pseudonocardia sulfidoxydans NBRC 16205 TaxID=1223511 RepID=A0A511DIH8_9PSEU|nr:hypothetical protein PSU4_35600 [Pseudonocardia sulfidoxydans NBRC 16205]